MLRSLRSFLCSLSVLLVISTFAQAQFRPDDGDEGGGRRRGGFDRGGDESAFGGRGRFDRGSFDRGGFRGRGGFGDGGFGGPGGLAPGGFDRGSFGDRGPFGEGGFGIRGFPGDGGFGGRGGFGGGGFDPMLLLMRLDVDADGLLEPEEMQGRARFMIDRFARGANLDLSQPVPMAKLQEVIRQARDGQTTGQSGPATTSSIGNAAILSNTATSTAATPLIPGFGAQFESVVVPGFGEPLAVATFGSLRTTASAAATAGVTSNTREPVAITASQVPAVIAVPTGALDRTRQIAQAMLNKYDANKDGILRRDEWSKMANEPEKGDKNGDGQITLDELNERLGGSAASSTPATSSSEASTSVATSSASSFADRGRFGGDRFGGGGGLDPRGASRARPASGASQRPYRFLKPSERLPEGLPSSFTSKDRDGDGQVTMAEYTNTWTESALAEFNRWDLNRDGWITARECLAAENGRQ